MITRIVVRYTYIIKYVKCCRINEKSVLSVIKCDTDK